VIVVIVGSEPEEHLRFVVDADRDDRTFGGEQIFLIGPPPSIAQVPRNAALAYDSTGHARGGDGIRWACRR
jgi:hypothetical protein